MKNYKRVLGAALSLCMILSLAACGTKNGNDGLAESGAAVTINAAAMKGPTSMGMVKFIDDAEAGKDCTSASFILAGSADEITPALLKGELDIAAIPANLASVLYNNTDGQIKVLAINTLGVLYIVSKGDAVPSVESLKGKTIYATGKGSTPEYTLRYILSENGLDPDKDVDIQFKSEPMEVVSALAASGGIAMLPQPYASAAMAKVEGLEIALDLTREWERLGTESSLITGVLVGRTEFVDAHPQETAAFIKECEDSAKWVAENKEEAAALIGAHGIADEKVAQKALPYCNICFIRGEEMKTALCGYLEVLLGQNPKAVGGKLPDDGFYYFGE